MKTKISLCLLGAALVIAGCVKTVTDRKTGGVPFVRDRFEGHYERSVDEVFTAAKAVISDMGVLNSESILHNQTNAVKTAEGRINERRVWVRVEAESSQVTGVAVQARTSGGGTDMSLTHEIEKNIALKLVR